LTQPLGSGLSYEASVSSAIDDGLSLLGESGKKAIYYYLDKDYGIKRGDICAKISDFSNALDRTFGAGSEFIKIRIILKFYEKANIPVHEPIESSRFVELLKGEAIEWETKDSRHG